MDNFTRDMILKKIGKRGGSGKAVLNLDTFAQTFPSEEKFEKFLKKHKLRFTEGRGAIILRKRG